MMTGQTISHYKILEKLGEGGMGVVYKAEDTKLDRIVALKFLPQTLTPTEEDRQRFIREAKAAAALNHPNICTIHNIDEHEGNQFIVMEYIEGETLRAKIESGNLTIETALDYAAGIAGALAKAHENDIIHRDIKPENIMVNADGHIKVMDFGLAKLKHTRDITQTGSTVGTLAYMSPEQIQGKEVDRRSDIFSLGIVLYEMLTGQKPFRGEHEAAMMYAIVNEEPTPISRYLSDVPEALERFFERALEKDSEDRFSSADELKQALGVLKRMDASFTAGGETVTSDDKATGSQEEESDGSSTTISITLPGINLGETTLSGRRLLIGVAGILVMAFFVGWWFVGLGLSGESTEATSTGQTSEPAGESIAVLPFQVSGSGAKEWEDGMVTMLSLNLDGAAGLRAITDRNIFATLREQGFSEEGLSTRDALEVAREIGARYAVVGSAGQIGENLRFGADIHKTSSGDRIGHVEAQGISENVTNLINELTRQVLGVLLEGSEESMPTVDLESLTTESLSALKAYLEGERRFRAGEYEAALENFETAIQEDITFALAYYRLYSSMVWSGRWGEFRSHLERAYELSDRLPLRERRNIWASYTWNVRFRALIARDSLRQFTEDYPEDPRMWNNLAEVLFHSNVPGGWPEADQAFKKAAELDPDVAQVHHHLVDLAFSLHRDSALAAERIAAHPEGDYGQAYQVALNLVFGTDEERQEAFSRLDSIPSSVTYLWIQEALSHPLDRKLQTEVLQAFRTRYNHDSDDYQLFTRLLTQNRLERGQVEEAISLLQKEEDQAGGACRLALSRGLGYTIPNSLERSYLEPAEIGEDEASPQRLLCTGIYLIEEGSDEKFDALVDRLRESGIQADDRDTARVQVAMNELRGYRAWKKGDAETAERLLSSSKRPFWSWGALWRGDLYRELGELKEAEEWYMAAWQLPVVHERMGQLYEEMDRSEKAAKAYERFIEAWNEADEPLQKWVEEARNRILELSEE